MAFNIFHFGKTESFFWLRIGQSLNQIFEVGVLNLRPVNNIIFWAFWVVLLDLIVTNGVVLTVEHLPSTGHFVHDTP